jgi:hypothetical protein
MEEVEPGLYASAYTHSPLRGLRETFRLLSSHRSWRRWLKRLSG